MFGAHPSSSRFHFTPEGPSKMKTTGLHRSIKLVEQFAKQAPRFRVTEGMLEVLDDYLANLGQHGTNEEGRAALARHFPELSEGQIKACLRRWKQSLV